MKKKKCSRKCCPSQKPNYPRQPSFYKPRKKLRQLGLDILMSEENRGGCHYFVASIVSIYDLATPLRRFEDRSSNEARARAFAALRKDPEFR